MHYDVHSDFNLAGGLPKGSARQALDESIANEGQKVIASDKIILSNGEQVAWTAPPEKLSIPDLSNVKSLRHYFSKSGYQVYPAWLYHPDGRSVLVKNAGEAADHGVVYRETTQDERNSYGLRHRWDWEAESKWRPNPWVEQKFDPKNPGACKTVIYSAPDPVNAQHSLIAALLPAVVGEVTKALKSAEGSSAPASIDAARWEAFLAFEAWQKTQEVVAKAASGEFDLGSGAIVSEAPEANALASNALSPEQDRMILWEAEAKRLGIKVDGRWSLERLRSECEKAGSGAA